MKKLTAMRLFVHWFSGRIPKLLLLVVLIILAVPHFASSATFTVNSTTDANDVNPGNGLCETAPGNGVCTLRAAIQESNAVPGFPPAQITLPSGTYVLTLGQLGITDSLFLNGEDPNSTIIDGNKSSRVFAISNTGTDPIVNMSGVTVRNGTAPNSTTRGGGIFIDEGSSLSLFNCIVSENQSDILGAGISNDGFLQIFSSTIRNNKITGLTSGGGQTAIGGGLFNSVSGTVHIDRSTISGNQATRGGGIDNQGHLEITNSTISGNMVFAGGGGIRNVTTESVFGSGTVFIAFSTITKNVANLGAPDEPVNRTTGGGILNFGTVSIGNTILAGNTDNRVASDSLFSPDCLSRTDVFDGTFTSFRGNLVGIVNTNCNLSDTIFGNTAFDMVGTAVSPLDPRLGPLANNGGPTQTHALLSNSPAIDQGTGVTSATFFDCPKTDQRGLTRPVDGNSDGKADCDVGAFEFGAIPPETVNNLVSLASNPVTSLSAIPTPNGPAGTLFITATFTNMSTIPLRKPFFQVVELSGGNVLINADSGPGGVGATLTPNVGPDQLLTPGESVTTEFRIGLETLNPFTFLVDVMGEPVE